MKRRYLLDTNQLSHAVTKGSSVMARVHRARGSGALVGTCVPVLCEVEAGVQFIAKPVEYRENLARVLRAIRIWPIEVTTSRRYGEIYGELRRRGRVLSQVDMMLAALAAETSSVLVTTDSDFEALPDIKTENWIVPDAGTAGATK